MKVEDNLKVQCRGKRNWNNKSKTEDKKVIKEQKKTKGVPKNLVLEKIVELEVRRIKVEIHQ